MELSNSQLWFFVALAAIIIWMRMRKNRIEPVSRGKQVSIRGERLVCELTVMTPLICLLEDGKTFGPSFHDKVSPQLPHCEGCKCQLLSNHLNAEEIFVLKEDKLPERNSDLGQLPNSQSRYYRYLLLANHSDASEAQKLEFSQLAQGVGVSPQVKHVIEAHMQKGTT